MVNRLSDRLRVLQVAHQLRQLCVVGIPVDHDQLLEVDHPLPMLASLLNR